MSVPLGNYILSGRFDSLQFNVLKQTQVGTSAIDISGGLSVDNSYTRENRGMSPACISSDGKNMIYSIGTYPNYLVYYSNNYGANWALSDISATIIGTGSGFATSPKNYPNVFYLATVNGSYKIYRSTNGGKNFTLVNTTINNAAGICVNDNDTILYVSSFNDGVYYSTNQGTTLTRITNSNNSFAYANCVCSSDGMKLFGTNTSSKNVFTYNFSNTSSFSVNLTGLSGIHIYDVAMDSTGSYYYASTFNNASNALYRSTNGVNFSSIGNLPTNRNYYLSCDSTGQYIIAVSSIGWYTSSNYGSTFSLYNGPFPSPYVPIINNNKDFYIYVSNTTVLYVVPYPCFLEGSKILRMNPETDTDEYVAVEKLRRGDLILTAEHGYKAIELIGCTKIQNPNSATVSPSKRLYWFRKSKIRGMTEDLCVTGDHCILHKSISEEKKASVMEYMRDIYVTESHYRVPAFLDDRAEQYTRDGPATIWHFALENPNIYHNYGVMANGLLVESCSLHYMYKHSNMKML